MSEKSNLMKIISILTSKRDRALHARSNCAESIDTASAADPEMYICYYYYYCIQISGRLIII